MVGIKGDNPWIYSAHRMLDTFIGVCITIFVNNFMFRTNLLTLINRDSIEIKQTVDKLVKEKICTSGHVDIDGLSLKIEDSKNKLKICIEEYGSLKHKKDELKNLRDFLSSLASIHDHLKIICTMKMPVSINAENNSKLQNLFNCSPDDSSYEVTPDNIVFNYHLGEILDRLSYINEHLHKVNN
jgi:hypothetical protein